jgi:hypothetical protein
MAKAMRADKTQSNLMEESRHLPRRKIVLGPQIQRISFVTVIFCLVAVIATFFSLPALFVRQSWVREVLGFSGLLQVMVLLIALRQIEKHHSIPALLVGAGLVLNEQILACRGFWILTSRHSVDAYSLLYFIFSTLAGLILGGMMMAALRDFYLSRKIVDQRKPPVNPDPLESLRLLIPTILVYGLILFGVFYTVNSSGLEGPFQFSILKNLGWIASAFSAAGIGFEINDYIDGIQTKKSLWIKSLSHAILLSAVLWAIYRTMPIESVMILS